MNFSDLTEKFLEKSFIKALIAVNILGTFFGFYYYMPQLAETSISLWPLIPDSPISTLLIALSFYIFLSRGLEKLPEKLETLVHSLAFIGNIKYGIWTVFVLLKFQPEFMAINTVPMYLFLILSHLGMFLQAFLILEYIEISKKFLGLAVGVFLFNDLLDYILGVHTSLPETQGLYSIVSTVAFALTIFSGILLYWNDSRQ